MPKYTWTQVCLNKIDVQKSLDITPEKISQSEDISNQLLNSRRAEGKEIKNFESAVKKPNEPAFKKFHIALRIIGELGFLAEEANLKGEWHLEERIADYRSSMRSHLEAACRELGADADQATRLGTAAIQGTKAILKENRATGL